VRPVVLDEATRWSSRCHL